MSTSGSHASRRRKAAQPGGSTTAPAKRLSRHAITMRRVVRTSGRVLGVRKRSWPWASTSPRTNTTTCMAVWLRLATHTASRVRVPCGTSQRTFLEEPAEVLRGTWRALWDDIHHIGEGITVFSPWQKRNVTKAEFELEVHAFDKQHPERRRTGREAR